MKTLLNLLIVVLSLTTIWICYAIPDHKVYAAGEVDFGNSVNMFGLIFGTICILKHLGTLSDKNSDSSSILSSSVLVFFVFILNWILILIGFTVDTSSMLSNAAGKVQEMGIEIKAVSTNGAYYPIAIAALNILLSYLRGTFESNSEAE
jgi:hypothetical protein